MRSINRDMGVRESGIPSHHEVQIAWQSTQVSVTLQFCMTQVCKLLEIAIITVKSRVKGLWVMIVCPKARAQSRVAYKVPTFDTNMILGELDT